MRKGQMISQVFVLIIAAIIFVLILAYGYSAIRDILQKRDQVAFIDFSTQLKQEVRSISLSHGSVRKIDLTGLPPRFDEICFVTSEDSNPDTEELDGLLDEYPLIYELYEPHGPQNVFFLPSAPEPIFLENIRAKDPDDDRLRWFCEELDQGAISLRLESRGNIVTISPA